MINKTLLAQLCFVWLSSVQGAYVPRNHRSAAVPDSAVPAVGLNADFRSSPSPASTSSLPAIIGPAGFHGYNPGGVALPAAGYPTFGFDDFAGQFQLPSLLRTYAAPTGDFRFPGFGGYDVTGYPFAAPQPYPTAGDDPPRLLRFDPVPRALPAAEHAYAQLAPQTNHVAAPSGAPIPAEAPPRQYYNHQVGDGRPLRVPEHTASGPAFEIAPAADQPHQQPIQTVDRLVAAPPAPSGPEPVPDLVLELTPPPYTAQHPDMSFNPTADDPVAQRPHSSADPIDGGAGPASSASGPSPVPLLPPGRDAHVTYDGHADQRAAAAREPHSTTPAGPVPDAHPTPSISYSLPGETFRLPGETFRLPGETFRLPGETFRLPGPSTMSPIIVVPQGAYPADGHSTTGSTPHYYDAGGSANPISANTYGHSNAIQDSSYGRPAVNPKPLDGTFFDGSTNAISSNGKRETAAGPVSPVAR